jgi:hypothetical protein
VNIFFFLGVESRSVSSSSGLEKQGFQIFCLQSEQGFRNYG